MLFGLIGRPKLRARTRKPSSPVGTRFRPVVEGLEERVVLDHSGGLAPALGPALVQQAALTSLLRITDVDLTNVRIEDNVLRADGTVTGTLAGLPFTTDITNFALQLVDDASTPAEECSILNLELAPINLSLLGLHVDTSPICLEITATEGGGLLGDLLCGIAGGLPDLPTLDQFGELLDGLEDILNGVFANSQPGPSQGGDSVCTGECEILELSVGPLDLSVLGLNVFLDDCDGGPVQVCVSATESEGLLGDLLCGLSGSRLRNLDLGDITRVVDTVDDLLGDGDLSKQDLKTVRKLFKQVLK